MKLKVCVGFGLNLQKKVVSGALVLNCKLMAYRLLNELLSGSWVIGPFEQETLDFIRRTSPVRTFLVTLTAGQHAMAFTTQMCDVSVL